MSSIKSTIDHKCPACNAKLTFKPETQNWVCEYCDSKFTLEDLKKNEKKYKDKVVEEEAQDQGEYNMYKCPDCGAEIVTDLNTTATFCVYCKNTSIIKERLIGKFEPKYIIPFQNVEKDAISAFKKVGRKHPLMPSSFTNKKNISEIKGIYIPFWLLSATAMAKVNKTGKKIKTWSSGNYTYTKTDVYDVYREGEIDFKHVPCDGSKKFDDAIMNSIEPFDYSKLKEFNPAYLSGFLSEKYDLTSEEIENVITKRVANTTDKIISNDIKGYSSLTTNSIDLNYRDKEVNYVLLPVWLLNIKYKDKMYTFAMNGETGKMIGNLPVDGKKTILLSIIIYIISYLIMLGIFYLFIRSNV